MSYPQQILVLGDSLLKGVFYDEVQQRHRVHTTGCLSLLMKDPAANLINHSRFGLTTTAALPLLPPLLDRYPDATHVLLELGGNDCDYAWSEIAHHPDGDHQCHTSLHDYCVNLEKMVNLCREAGRTPWLATLPPIDANKFFLWVAKTPADQVSILEWLKDQTIIERHQARYNQAVCEVAKALDCPLLDLRTPILAVPSWRSLLCRDGIHLNEQGQDILCRVLSDFLQKIHP